MRGFHAVLTFLAFLLLTAASPLLALDDWLPVTPEDRKITAESEKGADAVILYHEETSDDKTRHRHVYKRVKILTEKGKSEANVEIPYDAAYGGVSDVRARTLAPDGTITAFTGKVFNTTVVKGHGIKYQAKTFSLPNVQVGSIVEWKYTEYWDEYLLGAHWVIQDDLPQKRAKFAFIPFSSNAIGVEVVDKRGDVKDRVYYSVIGLPQSTTIKNLPNNRMELELKDIPAFQQEDFSPPSAVLKMRVNFYYGTDKMGKPQEFWKQEGKYWSKEVEAFIGHSSDFASTLSQIAAPADSPEQKLRKIYAYVQKIKNLSYEREERRLEELLERNSKEKHTAETVLRKQEGKPDEITRVFIGLARAAGIQAYAMRVADRDQNFFQPTIPNPSQLTSEIAIAVLDGKDVFLDPATPFCPFGLLPWQHNSTSGIRQTAGGGTEISAAPKANYKEAISKRVGRLVLTDDGTVHGEVAIGWTGIDALVHRLSGFKTDEAGRKKELEDELKAMLPPGASVQLLNATGWETPDQQLSARFKVDVPSFAGSTGKRLLVPTYLFQAAKAQPFAHGERKNPIYFNYPYYTIDDVQITFPSNLKLESLPTGQPLRTEFSLYKVERTVNGHTISLSRDFAMAGIAFMQQDYPELKRFFEGVSSGDSDSLVLSSAQ
jgi:Domain of Unknown Function with PDB structure (DUF3857)/Transglutaminase-like superfamily